MAAHSRRRCHCHWGVRDNLGLSLAIFGDTREDVLRKRERHLREIVDEADVSTKADIERFVASLGDPQPVFVKCPECSDA